MAACIFRDQQVDSILKYIKTTNSEESQYVFFTKVTNKNGVTTLLICISDGYNIYQQECPSDDLDTYISDSKSETAEEFLSKIRRSVVNNDLKVQLVSDDILLYFNHESFHITCYMTTASERKDLFPYVFFKLAQQVEIGNKEIKTLDDRVVELESQITKNTTNVSMATRYEDNFGGDFKHNKQSKPKLNVGGSLINPRIKKRKAATGVVFGDD